MSDNFVSTREIVGDFYAYNIYMKKVLFLDILTCVPKFSTYIQIDSIIILR